MKKYNVVDLFSGAGGLSLGFMQTGRVNIVAAAENNPNARKTYKRNFKQLQLLYSDVQSIDYGELVNAVDHVDIVIGGPPCQGFSNANRQHTHIVSMNNRLVKEFVRAICELQPSAFVMENVAMLKSQTHRFMVENSELNDDRIKGMPLREDRVEILPKKAIFDNALSLIENGELNTDYVWADGFYKIINLLYRYRINQPKFNSTLQKHGRKLIAQLKEIARTYEELENPSAAQVFDADMAQSLVRYYENQNEDFNNVISKIEKPLILQRGIQHIKELTENNIHIYGYQETETGIYAIVQSYPVSEYIRRTLSSPPYDYELTEQVMNAICYGAPQKRERFVIVGISKTVKRKYSIPETKYNEENCHTVRDAISDIQDIDVFTEVTDKGIPLQPHPDAQGLEKTLRGKLLYNHIVTDTGPVAMERFKALGEGQNFHDLDTRLKSTYSNAERTQNTIYMRLRYDEPSGTVVNVRKSMWIHPVLNRAISIREAARLQTFPDTFIFEGTKDSQYQQVGNAVPPFLAKAVADSIITTLDGQ